MLNKAQKAQQIQWISDQIKTKPLVVFTTYRGLNIADMSALRRQLKQQGIGFKAVKSSLLRLALNQHNLDLDPAISSLPLAIAFGEDEVMPAKLVARFIKEHDPMQIVGGVINVQLVDAQKIKTVALLPSRQELYASFVGILRAPAAGFINTLAFPGRGLTQLLKQKFVLN